MRLKTDQLTDSLVHFQTDPPVLLSQEAPDSELDATLQQLAERPMMTWSRTDLRLGRWGLDWGWALNMVKPQMLMVKSHIPYSSVAIIYIYTYNIYNI